MLTKNSARPPWRFIDSIAVEEFCFGLVPPQVQFCFARYDQVKSLLQLSLDVRFVSSGAQAVVSHSGVPTCVACSSSVTGGCLTCMALLPCHCYDFVSAVRCQQTQ